MLLPTAILLTPLSSFAQGPITPPVGPPAASMKTLDQVEARRPLVAGTPGVTIGGSGTITIAQSGSYYLTGNLIVTSGDGIQINSGGVTLDLNGQTISSSNASGSGNGISIAGAVENVEIHGGHIRGGATLAGTTFTAGGFINGVSGTQSPSPPAAVLIHHLTVSSLSGSGITLTMIGNASRDTSVSDCILKNIGIAGVLAGTVQNTTLTNGGRTGIGGRQIENCSATVFGNDASSYGITGDIVDHCYGKSDRGFGIYGTVVNHSIGIGGNIAVAGIVAEGSANYCHGTRTGGQAINAAIAVACTSGGGSIDAPQKHLGTP